MTGRVVSPDVEDVRLRLRFTLPVQASSLDQDVFDVRARGAGPGLGEEIEIDSITIGLDRVAGVLRANGAVLRLEDDALADHAGELIDILVDASEIDFDMAAPPGDAFRVPFRVSFLVSAAGRDGTQPFVSVLMPPEDSAPGPGWNTGYTIEDLAGLLDGTTPSPVLTGVAPHAEWTAAFSEPVVSAAWVLAPVDPFGLVLRRDGGSSGALGGAPFQILSGRSAKGLVPGVEYTLTFLSPAAARVARLPFGTEDPSGEPLGLFLDPEAAADLDDGDDDDDDDGDDGDDDEDDENGGAGDLNLPADPSFRFRTAPVRIEFPRPDGAPVNLAAAPDALVEAVATLVMEEIPSSDLVFEVRPTGTTESFAELRRVDLGDPSQFEALVPDVELREGEIVKTVTEARVAVDLQELGAAYPIRSRWCT